MKKSNQVLIRLTDQQKGEIKRVAAFVDLPVSEVVRRAMYYGLPTLLERFKKGEIA